MARRSSFFDFLNPFTAPMAIVNSVQDAVLQPGHFSGKYGRKPPTMKDKHYDAGKQIAARKKQKPRIRIPGASADQYFGAPGGGVKYGPDAFQAQREEVLRYAEAESRRRMQAAMEALRASQGAESAVLTQYVEQALVPHHSMIGELVATDVETAAAITALSKDVGAVSTEVHKTRVIAEQAASAIAASMKRVADVQINSLIDDISEAPHVDAKQAAMWTSQLMQAKVTGDWETISKINSDFRGRQDSIIERIKSSWMSSAAALGITVVGDWDVVTKSPNVVLEALTVAVLSAILGRNDVAMIAKFIIPAMTWIGTMFVPQRLGLTFSGAALSIDRSTGGGTVMLRAGIRAKGSTLTSANASFRITAVEIMNFTAGVTFVGEALADGTTLTAAGAPLGDLKQRDCADKDVFVTAFFPSTSLAASSMAAGDRVRIKLHVKPTSDVALFGEYATSEAVVITARP